MIKHQNVYDSASRSIFRKLIYAIQEDDIMGLKYVIVKTKAPDIETLERGLGLMVYAYSKDFLEAVNLLVHFGLRYHPVTLLHSHPSMSNRTVYEAHLMEMKAYFSGSVYGEVSKLLKSITNPAILNYTMSDCINYSAMIGNFTYTDDIRNSYKIYDFISSVYKIDNIIVKEAFISISQSMLAPYNNQVFMYMPIIMSSEGHHGYMSDFTTAKEMIYLPLENLKGYQAGILVHELIHAAIQFLFKNKDKPYPKLDIRLECIYHDVIKRTIIRILQLFDGYKAFKADVEVHYGESDPFNLAYYDFIKAASHNALIIFKYKNSHNDPEIINDIYFSCSTGANKDSSSEVQLSYVKNAYNYFIKNYQLTEDQLEMLDRIAECITRPPEDIDSEMIVRIGELYAKGLSNATLEPLALVENYWLSEISPEVSKLKETSLMQECSAPIAMQVGASLIGGSEIIMDYIDRS